MDQETEKLKEKVEAYLQARLGADVKLAAFRQLSGGAVQENFLADVEVASGPEAGKHELVMRMDAGASLLASLSRPDEYRVIRACFEAGVQTPAPRWLEEDRSVLGRAFYFMQRIPGRATGRYIVKERELNEVRKRLAGDLAASLAKIHSLTPDNADQELQRALQTAGGPPQAGTDALAQSAVADVRGLLDDLPEARPACELALNQLEKRAPVLDQPVLVHGDFRTGNFMVSPEGLHGIVDWEFAHWGDRHEDIAWLCLRDWRFGKTNKEVGGFADRAEFYEAYALSSGVQVDPFKVRWWEIMGNLRWAAGSAQQTERHMSGAVKGIELASIGRRAGEMEFEALRLIEELEAEDAG